MDLFSHILKERILLLDGAMGTQLQAKGLVGDSEAFNLSHPDVILGIHQAYIEAGADIIETNSFGANRLSQEEYGRAADARDMALAAARIARKAADGAPRKIWVAGSVGPTGKSLTLPQRLDDPLYRPCDFDGMAEVYGEEIGALVEGGVDLILLETCFDALNVKAALYALGDYPGVPVIISASPADRSGRTLTGQTLEAFFHSVRHGRPVAFGLNCSLGATDMLPLLEDVASWCDCPVCCYPNAGLPNEMGTYDETPSQMAEAIRSMAGKGLVNIVGGCCGTTPDHIRALKEAVRGLPPRPMPEPDIRLHVSGLEAVTVDREKNLFTNIGERTNVAGSRKFARLIASGAYEEALEVAAGQIEGGASVIDINMDDAMLDPAAEMQKFLRYVSGDPAVARAAVMIDSSHWDAVTAGLKNAQGKCIVNSISLKEGEEVFLSRARELRRLGAAAVVMAFDEEGQAIDYERKIRICQRAWRLLTEEAGFAPSDIIFDVNVLSVGTGLPEHRRYGVDFIEAVRWIKSNLPGALTSGGISNLSFAFRGNNRVREAMHSVFLYHAIAAGLDMGIVNPGMLQVYDEIEPDLLRRVEDVILDRDSGAVERLLEKAAETAGDTSAEKVQSVEKEDIPVEEKLIRALLSGGSPTLREDLMEALSKTGKAVDVIEGPLMEGMARVGERFGAGKMFLPQVVKSARVMRDAVAFLQPYLEGKTGSGRERKPVFLLATVKGDVHDIGKNILSIVLQCNGFEVVDLGVMVPKETILEKAAETGADLIGVSGLISPSLRQMEDLCREMAQRGMQTPLLVGGATTSALHTAVKLAPLYDHVFYGADASASAVLSGRLMSDRVKTEETEHAYQQELRDTYLKASSSRTRSVGKADPFAKESFLRGKVFPDFPARKLTVEEVLPYFDWRLFDIVWGLKGDAAREERARLHSDAEKVLGEMAAGGCRIVLCARFDPCHSEGDTIVSEAWRLPMLRQEEGNARSLADFVPPQSYGFESPAGLFAISVHRVHPKGACDCAACRTEYGPMLERSVRLTLAEAASAWLDAELRKSLPEGSPARIVKPAAGYASCPDHSLKRDILSLLPGGEALDIRLTETCAMIPDASICGLVFAHPEASYPEIRHLSRRAVDAYAGLRGFSEAEKTLFLGGLL